MRAVYRSLHSAARAPRTLFAAICSPCPLPPSTMPRSASPRDDGPADRRADRRVVDRVLGAVGAEVVDVVAPLLQHADEVLLERIARVVAADRDAHAASVPTGCPVRGFSGCLTRRGYRRDAWIVRGRERRG